ncbi:MAG: PEP-CTERM sorting domain-containing protein [Candidatus Auribacterota bacterium]
MKVKLIFASLTVLLLASQVLALPNASLPVLDLSSGPVVGESDLLQGMTGNKITVDWIVMTKSQLVDLTGITKTFGVNGGNDTLFADSDYYYFYQVENTSAAVLNNFQMNVEKDYIKTVGIFNAINLDVLFSHNAVTYPNLTGEKETATGNENPDVSVFTKLGTPAHVDWNYFSGIHLFTNEQSTVLFLTSDFGPIYNMASMLGPAISYDGLVPTPPFLEQIQVPEPMSLSLLGMGILFLIKKVRK